MPPIGTVIGVAVPTGNLYQGIVKVNAYTVLFKKYPVRYRCGTLIGSGFELEHELRIVCCGWTAISEVMGVARPAKRRPSQSHPIWINNDASIVPLAAPARRHFRHPVHQLMLMTAPARKPALQIAAQQFGIAGPVERATAALLDQRMELVAELGVMFLPMAIIVPRRQPARHFHGKETPSPPDSKPRTVSNRR